MKEYIVESGNALYNENTGKAEFNLIVNGELIRCKDCKHSEHWYRDKRRCFLWHEIGIGVFEDGYCNYAERKTDECN